MVTFDGRGNGRSDRPSEPEAYREEEFADDALAVMEATGTATRPCSCPCRAAPSGRCCSPHEHPDRVEGLVVHRTGLPFAGHAALKAIQEFSEPRDDR